MKRMTAAVLSLSIGVLIASHANAGTITIHEESMILINKHNSSLHRIVHAFEQFPMMKGHTDSLQTTLLPVITNHGSAVNDYMRENHIVPGSVILAGMGDNMLTCKRLVCLYVPPSSSHGSIQILYFTPKAKEPKRASLPSSRRATLWSNLGDHPLHAFKQLRAIANGKHSQEVFQWPLPDND
jgi:hypothetical protein